MLRSFSSEQAIFKSTAKLKASFTMDTTDVVTSAAHGLEIGDCVQFTTTTTLPAGLSLATNYYVISIPTTGTFKVSLTPGGVAVTTTGAGTGTHSFNLKGRVIFVRDYVHKSLSVYTAGSANFTIKIQKSNSETCPNFNAARSATNRWEYVQNVDTNDSTKYDGDTGISFAGTDDQREFEINDNGPVWITIEVSSWVAGTLFAGLSTYNNR